MNEPLVAQVVEDLDRKERARVVGNLASQISQFYGMKRPTAVAVTEIALGTTGAAGEYLRRSKVGRKRLIDITISMLLGGVERLAHEEQQ